MVSQQWRHEYVNARIDTMNVYVTRRRDQHVNSIPSARYDHHKSTRLIDGT